MKYRKEFVTTAGTFACAIGIGFFMQNAQSAVPEAYQGATLANAEASVLDVQEILLTSAEGFGTEPEAARLPEGSERLEDAFSSVVLDMPEPPADPPLTRTAAANGDTIAPERAQPGTSCAIESAARPMAAAMVNLTLTAPCLPNERVTVHHAGLLFNQTTDPQGAFEITVPAMEQDAMFIVAFTNGEGAVAQTTVEEMADFDRVALQWKGKTGFELHALEFGADYASDGHVWSGAPRDVTFGATGTGGYLTQLGDRDVPDGLLAEVYTFPSGTSQTSGAVTLTVEAQVTTDNCGLEIEARTLQTASGIDITSRDLTLSVPECDAAGNFLVLNNLLKDLKVASR